MTALTFIPAAITNESLIGFSIVFDSGKARYDSPQNHDDTLLEKVESELIYNGSNTQQNHNTEIETRAAIIYWSEDKPFLLTSIKP